MNVGKAIKKLRKKNNYTQEGFCKKIDISQTYLSQIENNKKTPSGQLLAVISDVFKIPLPILFWFSVEEEDISKNKREAYALLKPTIDSLLDTIIN